MITWLVQQIGTAVSHNVFPPYHKLIDLCSLAMANWSVVFDSILFNYMQEYVRARGNAVAHAQILKDCKDEIVNLPLQEGIVVELSPDLCLVGEVLLLTTDLPHHHCHTNNP